MYSKYTLKAISNTLLFMFGTIVGALIGHTEMSSLLDHRHVLVIFVASGMFFLTHYVPQFVNKFRQ